MKASLVLVAALAVVAVAAAEEKYTTKYDNVDLDEILGNERLFNKYAQCLLEEGDSNCTADGKELKKAIPDALSNECAKCNEKQKSGTKKVLKHLINHKKDTWEQLKAKYDPEGTYSKKYEEREKELHE
ncbi:ejaculatory bulb-specific protein 3-like [Schistocerca americana]|uniref:ejaculatory bulb-specific protein 3-like n=1 Tax=Schistocerca americana TaxID=7009 RepID=UPI001F4FF362|nr:ejaculatory bulb-specific protein 3-like [Schistocerca americana]XP_049963193.1 ejaculatory bulb-specific protein 3-like [Schistocerca serialis cubense]